MRVIDYFRKYSFEKVAPRLDQLFVINNGNCLKLGARIKWEAVFNQWAKLSVPIVSEFHVYLAARWEYTSPMVDMNCVVCDTENVILHPLAIHDNKEEALGMNVIVEEYIGINELDITAGLFWEMTYYPFDVI